MQYCANSKVHERNQITSWGKMLCYGLFYIFYLWMAAQIPYTHDDWDWGVDIGLNQLVYATVNSRYAGNAFVVIMTRSEFLKTVIMGSAYFLIPWGIARLVRHGNQPSKNQDIVAFLACNILLLTQKGIILAQTYNWVSGFANFGISILFLMVWINEILAFFADDPVGGDADAKRTILSAVAAACGNLFLENIALYTVMLGIVLCVWSIIRDRKIAKRLLAMTVGAVIGLCIMFSSNIYQSLFTEGTTIGGYREIPMVSYDSAFEAVVHVLSRVLVLGVRIYADNFIICVSILAMLACLLRDSLKPRSKLVLLNIAVFCSLIPCLTYDVICTEHSQLMYFYDFFVSVVFFATVSVEMWILFRSEKKFLVRLYAIWLSAPLVIAPLAVTTEIGHRLFLTSNIFLIMVSLMLLEQMRHCVSFGIISKLMLRACVFCVAVLLLINGFVYGQIGACKRERDGIIAEAVQSGKTVITLPSYPFEDYLLNPNPGGQIRVDYFKQFYGIPDEVIVQFE